ncbi:deoxycytidine triphosphate deaminase [Candidatus Saccharibacteria bacterium TM7i]|nr:deoxycytidine triphosphate deaminase [Candidatus Saccharibacteria bacterium TM7i]
MQTGVYSNTQIKEAIEAGQIVFHPYQPEHINGSSVDVTLGQWFFRTDRKSPVSVYNPFDKDEVDHYFGEPQKAISHKEWCKQTGNEPLANIPEDHPVIVLEPGERILAHTQEFIGILPPGTTSMQSRSTWGRNGVAVCFDAGWGDPGYINRWTMEIYNLNQRHSVVLPVGERIAQIVFMHTGEVEGSYDNLSGKYASGTNLENLIASWEPQQMLPRAWKDQRSTPLIVTKWEDDPRIERA